MHETSRWVQLQLYLSSVRLTALTVLGLLRTPVPTSASLQSVDIEQDGCGALMLRCRTLPNHLTPLMSGTTAAHSRAVGSALYNRNKLDAVHQQEKRSWMYNSNVIT